MADKKLEITPEQARNLFLNRQLLFNSKLRKGKTGVLRAIEKLGYVQIDTINVIERSHHIVFLPGVLTIRRITLFLSPFDNSIILRDRTENLFGFMYSLECYVPKHKRKYGYFSLPILWRNKFIGRIVPKANRKNNILFISNLHIESNKLDYDYFFPTFTNSLKEFSKFNNCDTVQ